jgi:hypothetical protein
VNGELGPQTSDADDEQQNYGLNAVWQSSSATRVEGRAYYARYDEISVGQLAPPRNTPVEPGTLHQRLGKLDATLSQVIGNRQFLPNGGQIAIVGSIAFVMTLEIARTHPFSGFRMFTGLSLTIRRLIAWMRRRRRKESYRGAGRRR